MQQYLAEDFIIKCDFKNCQSRELFSLSKHANLALLPTASHTTVSLFILRHYYL
jgi:hypothetical protein